MLLIDTIKTLFFDLASEVIIGLVSPILAIVVENKYGIIEKMVVIWHKIRNSKIQVRLLVEYKTNMPFDDIKEIIIDELRTNYGQLKVYQNNEQRLEVMLEDSFHISAERGINDEIRLQTNKITSHINFINKTLEDIFNIFKDIKRDITTSSYQYNEKDFTVYLDLPFQKNYAKFKVPKNIVIDKYEVKMFHEVHQSEVVLKGHYLKISSKQKDDLLEVIKCFTRVV